MIDQARNPQIGEPGLTGWQVFMMFLAFFGVMLAVNGVFLFHAITSFPGEDIKKSYLQGLNYNQTLEERSVQSALDWRAEAGIDDGQLVFRLTDAAGEAISQRLILAELRRPSSKDGDKVLTLHPTGAGMYTCSVEGLLPGRWRVRLQVLDRAGEETIFRATKTIFIAP